MKLKVRYENEFQIINLDEKATKDLWVSLSLDCDKDMTQEEMEKIIQDAWDEEFNKPEYNIYHRETRHLGNAKFRNHDGVVEVNTEEAIMRQAKDQLVYTANMDELEDRLENEYQSKSYGDWLQSVLNPKQVDMVVAIVLEGKTVAEYAALIGDNPNNVSHRFRRVLKKLKKVFPKTSF